MTVLGEKPDTNTGAETPRRADAVRNRERVIKAAEEVFGEKGVAACIPDVAERAGVGKGTVYRNFETKDDLVAAVLTSRVARFNEATLGLLDSEDAWGSFRKLILGTAEARASEPGLSDMDLPIHNQAYIAEKERSQELIGQLMETAKRQGGMRDDAEPDDVGVLFGGICRILNERGERDPEVWRRHAGRVVDAFRA